MTPQGTDAGPTPNGVPDRQAQIAERDTRIAELEKQVAETARTSETTDACASRSTNFSVPKEGPRRP